MAFDADAYTAALDCPAFTAGGRTYRGRVLSAAECARFQVFVQQPDKVDGVRAAKLLLTAWFPRPWWLPWNPAWRAFRKLPEPTQLAAIRDFLARQLEALPRPASPRLATTET